MNLPQTDPQNRKLIWLDDERDPADRRWHSTFPIDSEQIVWIKSFSSFVDEIIRNGLPAAICFDHDLGEGGSGMDAAKWLTEYCLDNRVPLPIYEVHSMNPVGKENIVSLLMAFGSMHDV